MSTLALEGLRKEFDNGRVVAVDGLDLEVEDGEFVTVVGPSGCGKTTTLRMVAGLETPTRGRILIGGEDVTDQSARERDVAMVFQNYALYPHKTVHQNMAFGLRMSTDLPKEERVEKVRATAEMMGIEELLDQKPDELSGGQKQRVALGRAIVREPEVFLFDEPLSNLDAKLRTSMRAEIQRLQNELGITAVYVTHDQEEAMTMGDRIVVLRDGELQQVGSPSDVYEHPTNHFVAGFIGSPSMNFLDVVLTGDGTLDDGAGFEYQLSGEYRDELGIEAGRQLVAGIRPEHVYPADEAGPDATSADEAGPDATSTDGAGPDATSTDGGGQAITARVEVVEPVGSDNYLYLDVGDEFVARVDADVDPEPGDAMSVTFDEGKIRLFDRETGEAVGDAGRVVGTPGARP